MVVITNYRTNRQVSLRFHHQSFLCHPSLLASYHRDLALVLVGQFEVQHPKQMQLINKTLCGPHAILLLIDFQCLSPCYLQESCSHHSAPVPTCIDGSSYQKSSRLMLSWAPWHDVPTKLLATRNTGRRSHRTAEIVSPLGK